MLLSHVLQVHHVCRFKLEASLPFPVDETEGKAKFDKAKHQLEVTLPTLPPPKPQATKAVPKVQEITSQQEDLQETGSTETNQDACDAADVSPRKEVDASTVTPVQSGVDKPLESSCHQASADVDGNSNKSATSGSKETSTLTENQRKWLELHAQQQKDAELAQAAQCTSASAEVPQSQEVQNEAIGEEFVSCSAWEGVKPGYVFTTGEHGTGYYKDRRLLNSHTLSTSTACTFSTAASNHTSNPEIQTVRLQPRLRAAVADDLD